MKFFFIFFILFFSFLISYLNYFINHINNLKKIFLIYCIIDNFGDSINYNLLKDLTNKEIIKFNYCNKNFYNSFNFPNFSFIGSILDKWFINNNSFYNYSSAPLVIYGTGFMSEIKDKKYPIRNLDIIAVRGNYSLNNLKNTNYQIKKKIILGDPGLLAMFLFNLSKIQKQYSLCIIPHYIDKDIKILENLNIKNSKILDITNENNFMYELAKCKRVISSSLHGLILADSLIIPNIRIILSDKIAGGNFKYNDYYSSFNLKPQKYFDLRIYNFSENDLNFIDKNYNITKEMILKKQCDLLINFPFSLKKKYKNIINRKCKKYSFYNFKNYFYSIFLNYK